MRLLLEDVRTPIGRITIATDEAGMLCAMEFEGFDGRMRSLLARYFQTTPEVVSARTASSYASRLRDYFAGDPAAFDGARMRFGGTDFQRAVWSALRRIPAGSTATYGEIAAAIGRPTAVRAVGAANGANPIVIAVPCHRVIGANGDLTGFGGGLDRKRFLLAHEAAAVAVTSRSARSRAASKSRTLACSERVRA